MQVRSWELMLTDLKDSFVGDVKLGDHEVQQINAAMVDREL